MSRRAEHTPPPRRIRSEQELLSDLAATLTNDFSLQMLSEYVIVTEGRTDVDYLKSASIAAKATFGQDLLEIPDGLAGDGSTRFQICTPGKPNDSKRGGVPQMVRLAESLKPYVFTLDILRGLVFIFDHDAAGHEAATIVRNKGYKNVLTLDPKAHPNACSKKQVVIEDLLSLSAQKAFFDQGNAWCSITFEDGAIVAFDWHFKSKDRLRDYVCARNSCDELVEIVRLLMRVRESIGLP
jgi:hypothetical protein